MRALGYRPFDQGGGQEDAVTALNGSGFGQNLPRLWLGEHDADLVQDTQGGLVDGFNFFVGQDSQLNHSCFSWSLANVEVSTSWD
jgi:hypothetical protein